MERCKEFFVTLQEIGRDWVFLGNDQNRSCVSPQRQSTSGARVKM
jgi:hypothetical protein